MRMMKPWYVPFVSYLLNPQGNIMCTPLAVVNKFMGRASYTICTRRNSIGTLVVIYIECPYALPPLSYHGPNPVKTEPPIILRLHAFPITCTTTRRIVQNTTSMPRFSISSFRPCSVKPNATSRPNTKKPGTIPTRSWGSYINNKTM